MTLIALQGDRSHKLGVFKHHAQSCGRIYPPSKAVRVYLRVLADECFKISYFGFAKLGWAQDFYQLRH
jgi:hypothetical protein